MEVSSVVAYPRWVMFDESMDVETTGSYSTADAKTTLVTARTSNGHPIGVSLRLAAPPAVSRVCVHFPLGTAPCQHDNSVIAAHGDSVLIEVARVSSLAVVPDYFVYNAGDSGAAPPRPPSLYLLPPSYRYLSKDATGLLRRGKDKIVVARLKIIAPPQDVKPTQHVAELLLFRSGKWWTLEWPQISVPGDTIEKELQYSTFKVIPVGDSTLCWAAMSAGIMIIISGLFDEIPGLRYVRLPPDPRSSRDFYSSRNVCVTAGNTVKYVNIFARCCRGEGGASDCKHSDNAYIIKTWTLKLNNMEWMLDGIVDATELWSLDAYKSLPRVQVGFPVVSIDEPHIICFMVYDNTVVSSLIMVEVDMRSKMLRSVYRHPKEQNCRRKFLLPSRVSYYLNSYYPGGSSQIDHMDPPPVAILDKQLTYDSNNSKLLQAGSKISAEPDTQASEIFAGLQEISSYGLVGDDMQKAISILSHDNGRRFISFLRILKYLRKDWLLMCIKASVA